MTLTLPQPPEIRDKALRDHLYRIQQLIEQEDSRNLKRDDVATRTSSTPTTYTTTATIGAGQDVVLADTDSGAWTLTLPPAADRFKVLSIINIGASGNTLTVDGNGSETINRATTVALADLDAIRIQSDGSNWFVL